MEIYLDANATTPVLPQARAAALAVMADTYGNPSSIHGSGLKARALLDEVRAAARRVLAVPTGQLLFTSGATEGIQTAVLSALSALRRRKDAGEAVALQLLYGATEHKAVPEALKHWNAVLGLHLPLQAIPVGSDGRHDLAWLRAQAPSAGLVCTMAANNETGVVSDLDGIADALRGSPALWLVDGVQALGKLALRPIERGIDYAPFSGHKLYAPKGIGMLYVREGAPFTPLLAGGGQEGALRAGTENMAGIAALGAVLQALQDGSTFAGAATLAGHRGRLESALRDAFAGLVFNAPPALSLPTTLNFAVPGLSSRLLLDLFDAAGLRVSGGSACSAAKAQPSYVLEAMGLPAWQSAAAVRLSFGAADGAVLIDEACTRIRACGTALRASCLGDAPQAAAEPGTAALLTRFAADGACCYLVADAASRRCVVVDPLPGLDERLVQWVRCRGFTVAAIVATQRHGGQPSPAHALRAALPRELLAAGKVDALGWPEGVEQLTLGAHRLARLAPGRAEGSSAYLLYDGLHEGAGPRFAFVGDAAAPAALEHAASQHTLLLPAHDPDNRFASTLACADTAVPASQPQRVELPAEQAQALLQASPAPLLVDVREPYEQQLGVALDADSGRAQAVPLSGLLNALPQWLALPAETPVLFYCRSGNRSAQAARALRRLGHGQAFSLAGGLALWPAPTAATTA